jgi:signal transduction histidine kinase
LPRALQVEQRAKQRHTANLEHLAGKRRTWQRHHISADHTVPYPCIRICDNGIGIPPSKRDTIFEQFVRVHAHRDDELGAQGMGLGLSIVRECMESMEGSVAVESVEGTGTTFVLCWPATGLR